MCYLKISVNVLKQFTIKKLTLAELTIKLAVL